MKRLLLDTHIFLWWLSGDKQLNNSICELISDNRNTVYISAASVWEIAIKSALGKLKAPENMDSIVEDEGFEKLAISLFHAEKAGQLPNIHRDPFDRMLIAQSQAEGLELVTNDSNISKYGIKIIEPKSDS